MVAFAVGNQIYLRRGSGSLVSDAVHEGTHALDWLRGFPDVTDADILSLEKRAFFFERQFQRATTGTSEFTTIEEMLKFIFENYP